MTPGTQIRSPLGFATLEKMTRYHVIYADERIHQRLVLAHFKAKPRKSYLTFLSIADYQRGRSHGLIKMLAGDEGARFPAWLEDRAEEVFDDTDDTPLDDQKVIKGRLNRVLVAAYDFQRIFSLLDPLPALRKLARECGTNEPNYVRDALAFFAFDQDPNVLRPPKSGRGKYPREQITAAGRRIGRPSHKGPGYGCDVTGAMKVLMQQGWERFARRKLELKQVYVKTLVHVFGCSYKKVGKRTEIIHPLGHTFPKYGQFRYWMLEIYGHETVWSTLLGHIEYRKRFPKTKGSYHEGSRDLLEKLYSDATTFEQLPKSLIGDGQNLPLIEVPEYDALTGMVVGIAWGVGSESSSLYRQARAVTALRKSLVGEVLGMHIDDADFPVSGFLPRTSQTDNGAGAAKKIAEINKRFGISPDLTPSYNPQTNAPVEQSHQRSMKVAGAPLYEVSKLTAVGMAKQAMLRIMGENRSRDISARLTPELRNLGIKTALELWTYLRAEERIQGQPVTDEQVILEYLPEVTFQIREGQLTRHGVIYRSEDFFATNVAQHIWKHEGRKFNGRAFDISNRVEWVVVDKRLIKVMAVPAIQEHEAYFVMGAHEMKAHGRAVLDARSTAKELNHAERVRLELDSMEETGHTYMASTLKSGRPKSRSSRRSRANNFPV